MIVVSPNLAVDRTLELRELRRGEVHRADAVVAQAGGKGVNAARVARELGADPLLVGFAGGAAGALLRGELEREGIRSELVEIDGETRFTVALVEPDGTTTLVNEPGPPVSERDCGRLVERVLGAARPDELVLLAGSLPPGAPAALYRDIAEAVEADAVVDASGEALVESLAARPFLVKPNLDEARAFGDDAETVARALVEAGAERALVTTGASGAVLAGPDGVVRVVPPAVTAVNPTGSGDALAAGLLVGLERGLRLEDALRLGTAAAADNASRAAAGRIERARVDELVAQVELAAVA